MSTSELPLNVCLFVCLFCLFICMGFFAPLDNFLVIWRHHHCRLRAANFKRSNDR